MKNIFTKLFIILSIIFLFAIQPFASVFSYAINNELINTGSETVEDEENYDKSMFIRSPSFSVYYNETIVFYDEYDKLIKVYDIESSSLKNGDGNYVDLSEYKLIDCAVANNTIYMLLKTNQGQNLTLSALSLQTLEFINVANEIEPGYSKINAKTTTLTETNYILISLTPDTDSESNPLLILINQNTNNIDYTIEIKLTGSLSNINLFKMLAIELNKNNHELVCLMFVTNNSIMFSRLELDVIMSQNQISISNSYNLTENIYQHTENPDDTIYEIESIDFIKISNATHLIISFTEKTGEHDKELSIISSFELGIGDDDSSTNYTYKTKTETLNGEYLKTNGNCLVYPNKQTITYAKFANNYSTNGGTVKNPDYTISYLDEDKFVYKTTNCETNIYETPWDSTPISTISNNNDVIKIGSASLYLQSKVKINDYDYCMYTTKDENGKDVNYLGFINNTTLTQKAAKTLLNLGYKQNIITVRPNAALYSLPTKVLGTTINTNLNSHKITNIKQNSRVEIVDTICGYRTNGSVLIKVKVNNSDVGYIDTVDINPTKNEVEFVITNATINKDGTNVYLESSSSSPIIYTLEKGKEVRINGARNTKTGFTYITFNDDFYEYSGYIKTDYIQSDSWSAMQIIGSILIAINIGLLILILVFRKKYIGGNGLKYDSSKKPNYNEKRIPNK